MPLQKGAQAWRRQWRRPQQPQYRSEQPYITGLAGGPQGYFTDQYGNPRLVWGDAVWALPGNAGRWNGGNWKGDYDALVTARAAQGFTVLYGKPMGTTQSGNIDDNGGTFDSLFPFQGAAPTTGTAAANPSTGLTEAYWRRIDYFLDSMKNAGITFFFNAVGYASDFESGPGPLAGKSAAEFTAYGAALGARYKSQPNIVWNLADDYFGGADDALLDAFLSGVRSAGDAHVVSIENLPESGSRNTFDAPPAVTAWGAKNGQYNFVYSYNQEYYGVEQAYAESYPVPVIQGDGYFYQGNPSYSGGTGSFAWDSAFRQAAWWALAAGARGKVHGSQNIWQWASTSLASAQNDWWYANNAKNIRVVVESLPGWQNLFPDLTSQLVRNGRGTRASPFASGGSGGQYEVAFTSAYVAASITPDGSLALLYLPKATTITIDPSQLGQGFTATWVDPVTGARSSAGTGTTYNSTAKGNNSQGDADWVLVFQGPSVNDPVKLQPGGKAFRRRYRRGQQLTVNPAVTSTDITPAAALAAGTGTALDAAAAIAANAALAAGTGTAQSPQAALGVNAALATGSGTAQGPQAALAVSAGLATGTGTARSPQAAIAVNAALATGSGTAQSPQAATAIAAGLATGTGTAQSPQAAIAVNAGLATGTGTAQDATVSTATSVNANAGLATGTGTAQDAVAAIAVNAGLATGTGTARGIGSGRTAGAAAGSGTAQSPQAAIAVNAGLATGTGTARDATANTSGSALAGLATGTGTAQSPQAAIAVNAGLATGTGTALGIGSGRVAGLAAGSGTAQNPQAALAVSAGLATGAGTAQSIGSGRTAGLATGTGTARAPALALAVNAQAGVATAVATALDAQGSVTATVVKGYSASAPVAQPMMSTGTAVTQPEQAAASVSATATSQPGVS